MSLRSAAPAAWSARNVLRASWPLFQASLPTCLPLAIIGVAASAVPVAEGPGSGEGHGLAHGPQWWGLYLACTALMLICYAAVLQLQAGLASARRSGIRESMRDSMLLLPASFALWLLMILPLLPGLWWLNSHGPGAMAAVLLLPGLAALLFTFFAWPLLIMERPGPWRALRQSILLVQRHWRPVTMLVAMLFAAVLVFVLLAGIFMAVAMTLAGPDAQTGHTGLSFSRWLMAALLSLPVTCISAVLVTATRAVRHQHSAD